MNGGQRFSVLQGHSDWVRSVAFSPDGQILAGGSQFHLSDSTASVHIETVCFCWQGDSALTNAQIVKWEISMFYSNRFLLALYLIVVSLILVIIMLSVASIE
jgi:WD40 repeat protein